MFIRVLLSVEFCFTLKTYLKRAPFYNASAEGKVGHAVGKDMEALQGRKAEQPIGRAGNDDRRPERYPARGIKGKASEQRDLRDDRRQKKPILFGLAEASRGEAPRGIQEGTESPSGDALCRKPGYFTPSSTRRTAVCGPACTVVWEGRTGDCPPYPDYAREIDDIGWVPRTTRLSLCGKLVLIWIRRSS